MTASFARLSAVLPLALALALLLAMGPTPVAESQDLKPPRPPTTYDIEGFAIHIDSNPKSTAAPDKRSVLVLGWGSDRASVVEARRLENPATGKPYDVIIGLGQGPADDPREVRRIILDHAAADANARALQTAIARHFGAPLEAGTLDVHSNGTTVGVTAIENGAIRGVREVHAMGPDIGFGARYVNPETSERLRAKGVKEFHVYRTEGDIVLHVALATEAVAEWGKTTGAPALKLAEEVRDGVLGLLSIPAAEGQPGSIVQYHEGSAPSPGFPETHFVRHYVEERRTGRFDPVSAPDHDDVKGVRIRFDERILAEVLKDATREETARLLEEHGARLLRARDAGELEAANAELEAELKRRFRASRPLRPLRDLVAISLRGLVAEAERYRDRWASLPPRLRTPGEIARIHGYVLDPANDDVILLGARGGRGAPRIEIDDLVVGIRSVWRDGETPLVSLDPDLDDTSGPQAVRIDGVAEDSGFALAMLEADYEMKKITAGIDPVRAKGYVTLREIVARDPEGFDMSRFWLYPVQPGMGDIQVASDGRAVLFVAGVQVLSEQMMRAREGLVGTGKVLAAAEEAATSFTRHYAAIAEEYPIFRRLEGLFDVVLLARIWRGMDVRPKVLDRVCELPYRQVNVPASYEGVKVLVREIVVRETDLEREVEQFFIQGGVQARVGAGRRSWLALDDAGLASLEERCVEASSGTGSVAVALDDLVLTAVAPDARRRGTTVVGAEMALRRLWEGDLEGADRAIAETVRADPYDADALGIRALVRFFRGEYELARRDAARARRLDPDTPEVALLASFVLLECARLEGNPDAALAAAEWALRTDPGNSRLRVCRGELLTMLDRTQDAKAEFEKAIELDPTFALAYARLAVLQIGEGWVATGKSLAKKAEALGSDFIQVKVALALAELACGKPTRAEKLAKGVLAEPACDPASGIAALFVLVGVAAARDDWSALEGYVALARELAPESPELLVMAAGMAYEAGDVDLAFRYLEEAERVAAGHPLVREAREELRR